MSAGGSDETDDQPPLANPVEDEAGVGVDSWGGYVDGVVTGAGSDAGEVVSRDDQPPVLKAGAALLMLGTEPTLLEADGC